jgi:regulator of protease activity HflC (stomatin/prohibitin superfamily)
MKKIMYNVTGQVMKYVIPILIIALLLGSFYIIPAGKRGVLLTFGKPSMDAMGEGLHMKVPFIQQIIKISIQTQKYEADASAASSDLQVVTSKIATNFHLTGESVPKLYQEVGLDYATKVIMPMEQEIVKSTTAKFTAEELITKREEVRQEMKTVLTERLASRGIIVEEVSIINFDFSKEFNNAIEQKVTSQQLKLKAEIDLQRITVEKEQVITQAEGQAEAQRLQKLVLTPELVTMRALQVQEEAIAKWNGIMPLVTGGATPFVSLGSFGNSSAF